MGSTIVLLFCVIVLQTVIGQTVHELVEDIQKLKQEALDWTSPTNSDSYIPKDTPEKSSNGGEFDFIIIGAGSTGTVLADRLSEITKWKILLIEAGQWENDTSDIPDMTDYLRATDFNWGYNLESQGKNLAGYIDNAFSFPRGKAIGGSSVINAMIYTRGNKADFDKWGKDNPGWSYKDVLPYFKKSEKVSFPDASPIYHGENGTLHVEFSRIFDQVGQAFLEAQIQLKRKVVRDYNGRTQLAFSIVQLNEIEGRRDSGSKAFIRPAKNRPNLKILPNTLVTKLLIHENNHTVYGVQYVQDGSYYYATIKKEVILSAGAVNTPQILMLSGIGPKDHLKDLGIHVLKDLPVGENLWDHLIYNYQSFSINYTYVNQNLTEQVEEYLKAKGPLTTADDLQCIGYVNLMNTSETVPDVEHVLHAMKAESRPYDIYKNIWRLTEDSYKYVISPTFGLDQLSIHSLLLHPESRGNIRLKSSSPFDYPLLSPNYFSHPKDALTLVAALKDQFKMSETPALKSYNISLIKVCHPACNCSDYGSNEFWLCMVKTMVNSVYHFAGTAKMGQTSEGSVVDSNLKVHGVKRLRIADCSVIPVTTSGHTNPVAYMIGEKAADLIKNNH